MKGMQKIKRGTGFRGVLEYALDNDKGEVIGGNMTGITPRELAKEFGQSRSIREDIEKPVWHNSLRLPKGEKLDPEKWVSFADDYMKKMGFNELHQRTYVLHDDEAGQHIHIIASRIDLTGKLYLGQNENLKSTQYISELEKEHGLTPTAIKRDPNTLSRKTITSGEKGLEIRTGEIPARKQLQTIIDKATADKPRFPEFVNRLHSAEVSILPSGKTGTPQGISFELDGIAFKGSDMGKPYGWKQLQTRIDYEPNRDQGIIDKLRQDPTPTSNILPKQGNEFYDEVFRRTVEDIKNSGISEAQQQKAIEAIQQRLESENLITSTPKEEQAQVKEEDQDLER